MDFSGFGHLFATQLSCDSCVAFFVARISEVLAEWRTISVWENDFLSLIKTCRSVRAYQIGTCPFQGFGRCTGSRDLRPYRRRMSILHHYCNYRPQIPAENRQVKRRNDGEQTDPYYGAPVVVLILADGSASTFVEDGSCVLENMMLGFNVLLSGAIFCAGYFVERRESMQTNNKMAVAPVGKLIWQMSIPPLISMFLQYSYNLIDSAFVARLSENALTAVSLSFPDYNT